MDTSINDGAIISRKHKREEFKKIIMIVVAYVIYMFMSVVVWYHNIYLDKEPDRNWELEWRNFLNRLYRGTEKDCIEQLRVCKSAFLKLCKILQERGGLVRTKNVPITEAVAMFLHILAYKLKYKVIQFS